MKHGYETVNDKKKFIITSIIGIIVSLVIILIILLTNQKDYKIFYKENSYLDYKIYLKENNFYEEEYLEKDQIYISSLIDNIISTFNYEFIGNEKLNYKYKYNITSTLQITDTNGSNIYEITELLLDEQEKNINNSNTFSINETTEIDYTKNNNIAKKFLDEYGLSAKARMLVKLNLSIEGEHEKYNNGISEKNVMTLEIPLTTKTLQITTDYQLSENESQVLNFKKTIFENKIILTIVVILTIIEIVIIIFAIYFGIKSKKTKTKYEKKLENILTEYKGYITETIITQTVEEMMKTKSLRIEIIKTFEGLIDIRDNLGKQILYHEEIKGKETIFYVITDNIAYVYILDENNC